MSALDAIFDDIEKGSATETPTIAPAPASLKSPINSMFDEIDKSTKTNAINSLNVAQKTNPDNAARALKASNETGIPYPAAEVNLDNAEQAAQGQKNIQTLDNSPKLTEHIANNPYAPLLMQDDIPKMGELESFAATLLKWTMGNGPGQGFIGTAKASPYTMASGFAGVKRFGADFFGKQDLSDYYGQFAKNADAKAKEINPETSGILSEGLSSGGSSFFQNALLMPIAMIPGGQPIALGLMGLQTGGQSYNKASDKGLAFIPRTLYAAADTVIEVGTEVGPMGALIHEAKIGTPLLTAMIHNALRENKGEQAATLLQNLNEWGALNPDKPFSDFVKEIPAEAAKTLISVLIGSAGNMAITHSVQAGVDLATGRNSKLEFQAQRAADISATLEGMQKTMEASKVLERSPDTLRTYAQTLLDDNVSEVYVNAGTLVEAGVNIQELAQILPSIQSQMEQVASSGDFVIPTAELLVNTAGTAYAQPMIDNLRAGADEMSRNDAKTHMQEQGDKINQQIDKVLSGAENTSEFMNQREEVKQALLGEMKGNTPFADKVNEANAMLAATHFAVEAQKLGIPAKELAAKYGLKFQDKTEEKSIQNKEDGEKQLNQRNEALIDMRKRHSVLKSIMKCLG